MSYIDHLNNLKKLSSSKKKKLISILRNTCPLEKWPRTMPVSVDPKLVLIGVSPGVSQNLEVEEDQFLSEPSIVKSKNSNFFYPDKNN